MSFSGLLFHLSRHFLTILTFLLLMTVSSSVFAQRERNLPLKKTPVLTSTQFEMIEMDKEDKGLIVYVSGRGSYFLFNGSQWLELGAGGDLVPVLERNRRLLRARSTVIDLLKENDRDAFPGTYIMDKEQRESLEMLPGDRGVIIFDGSYRLFAGDAWRDLGNGGNLEVMLSRQGTIPGLKEGFLYDWKQSNGIGVYLGPTFSSFFRDDSYPSNPFGFGASPGFEMGVAPNLLYRPHFQAYVYLGYTINRVSETFSNQAGDKLEASWTLAGPRMAFVPLMITTGKPYKKFFLGGGGYVQYLVRRNLKADTNVPLIIDPEKDTAEFDYGLRAQIGYQWYRFSVILSATNQINNLLISDPSQISQDRRTIKVRNFSLNLQYVL